MGDKLDKVIEGYKPISTGRVFYPRNMNLSEDFVNAFHREYDRLVGEGQSPKNLVNRFSKAMKFHASEERKYHKIDEEKAARELEEKKNTMKYDPRSKSYYKPVDRNKKPDEDGDGVPDWADKKPGEDDHQKSSKKGAKKHKKKHK